MCFSTKEQKSRVDEKRESLHDTHFSLLVPTLIITLNKICSFLQMFIIVVTKVVFSSFRHQRHKQVRRKAFLHKKRRAANFLMLVPTCVNTTPQMTRSRGAKVCSEWLQERIDDHSIQSDHKCTIGLKVQKWEFINWLCLRGDVARLHDRHQ